MGFLQKLEYKGVGCIWSCSFPAKENIGRRVNWRQKTTQKCSCAFEKGVNIKRMKCAWACVKCNTSPKRMVLVHEQMPQAPHSPLRENFSPILRVFGKTQRRAWVHFQVSVLLVSIQELITPTWQIQSCSEREE